MLSFLYYNKLFELHFIKNAIQANVTLKIIIIRIINNNNNNLNVLNVQYVLIKVISYSKY